jgi:hypothetical protein
MRLEFLTVPDELVAVADEMVNFLTQFGYSVKIEKQDMEYPSTPTIYAKRQSTTLFVEVDGTVNAARVQEWVSYARSCQADTQVALAIPSWGNAPIEQQTRLRQLGVGLYMHTAGEGVMEAFAPIDQAVNIALPNLNLYSNRVRKALGPSHEQIRRGQWREGFEDACNALEHEGRKYLNRHVASGRITTRTPKNTVNTPTPERVDKMPLGMLKDTFAAIQAPNASDSKIAAALGKLNPDRIRAAHKKRTPQQEATLRKNVGKQLWLVTAALKELLR